MYDIYLYRIFLRKKVFYAFYESVDIVVHFLFGRLQLHDVQQFLRHIRNGSDQLPLYENCHSQHTNSNYGLPIVRP